MFCLLDVLVRLSVPVQVTERLISEMTYNMLMETLNPTHSLTHSLNAIDFFKANPLSPSEAEFESDCQPREPLGTSEIAASQNYSLAAEKLRSTCGHVQAIKQCEVQDIKRNHCIM